MKTIINLMTLILLLFCSIQISYAQTKINDILGNIEGAIAIDEKTTTAARDPLCYIKDDFEWYTATNQMVGQKGDPKLANELLHYCQEQLKSKLAGKVQAITTGYFDQMDIDGDSKEAEHIEGATQMAIEQIINETMDYCRKQEIYVDGSGNVHLDKIVLHMSIRVSKRDIVSSMSESIKNDAEAKVRFNEKKFRDEAFKVFEQDKSQE